MNQILEDIRGQALAKVIAIGPGLDVRYLPLLPRNVTPAPVEDEAELLALLDAMPFDGILALLDCAFHPVLAYTAYARARERDRACFVPAGITPDGELAWLGPRASPEGICFRCLRMRFLAACSDSQAAIREEIASIARPVRASQAPVAPAWPEKFCAALAELFRSDGVRQQSASISIFENGSRRDGSVLPRPDCSDCRVGRAQAPPRSIFDPSAGIVRNLDCSPTLGGAAWISRAEMANSWFSPGWDLVTLGKGVTREAAELSALGEAVERYCSASWGRAKAGPPTQVAVPIDAFAGWMNIDCIAASSLPAKHRLFAEGEMLPSGERRSLPGAVVFMDHPTPELDGHYAVPNSNGLGAGFDLETATLSALFEIIERDALMRAWRERRCLGRIDPDDVDDAISQLSRALCSFGLKCELVSLETAGASTTVIALLRHEERDRIPKLSVGCAARSSIAEAAFAALLEAIQVHHVLAGLLAQPTISARAEALAMGDIAAHHPIDHALYYAATSGNGATDFLVRSPPMAKPKANTAMPIDTVSLVRALAAQGYDVYRAELTTPDIAALGWRCVRVISPQFEGLFFGDALREKGGHPFLHPLG